MIRSPHLLRTGLISATLVVLAVAGWLLLAPTQIGGETGYVTTSGISMAPRFHSGDLAVVRPKAEYRVGDVIAYHSKTLHLVVLHRIKAIENGRFVTRGDNNDFTDPDRPTRADVLGKLAFRVAHGGRVLHWLHTPFMAALLAGGMALLLFVGNQRRRRRRDHRRPSEERGVRPLASVASGRDRQAFYDNHEQTIFTTCAVVALVFLALAGLAFTRPTTKPVKDKTPYTEKVSFGYHAKAAPGPVYPDGVVSTGDPIFVKLVRRVRVKAHYRLEAVAAHRLGGTMEVVLRISSPTGWSRTIQLAQPKRFTGDYAAADVALDIPRLRSLIREVEKLTGGTLGSAYTLEITPRVHTTGTLGSQPLTSDYAPALTLQLDALKLRPNAGAPTPAAAGAPAAGDDGASDDGGEKGGLRPSRPGSVTASRTEANHLTVHGLGLAVPTARWIALVGLLLGVGGVLFTGAGLMRDPYDPAENVQRYRHLIVPIAVPAYDPARPPIDVTSIGALAQLAERSERLILHHEHDGADTYLVDDEGTLYRYQAHSHLRQIPALSVVDGAVYEGAAR
jgi:signal peptidase I